MTSLEQTGKPPRVATENGRDSAAAVPPPRRRERLEALLNKRATAFALFGGLLAISLAFKVRGLGSAYWIDEGLSVGIGSHPLWDIPGLLKLDGSPPLYYMLLHVWMDLFGTGEVATQSLSLIFGLLCIPAAFWAGWTLFGRRVAWAAAALAALNPFLTLHAYETRMYALITLLGLLASTAFAKAFVLRQRRWIPVFALLLVAMLYTHNWSLFFGAASFLAFLWLWLRAGRPRDLLRDGAIGFGMTALLYLPWLPTLAYQARHTGAPWSQRPMFDELIFGTGLTMGGRGPLVAIALGAGAGLAALAAAGRRRELRLTQTLLILFAGTVLLAFLASWASPAWASRYLAVVLAPLLLFSAAGLVHAGRLGLWALAIVLAINAIPSSVTLEQPTDEKVVAEIVGPRMEPGDLVIVSHPERVPIMRHYLGDHLRYADLFGMVPDPGMMDWTDALDRIKHVRVATHLQPLLDNTPVGARVMLVRPIVDKKANSWKAPWTKRVGRKSRHWARTLNADRRFRAVIAAPTPYLSYKLGVRAVVYERVR